MYGNFQSWANEFDSATLEQKKMIIGQLVKRVELEKGYVIHIEFNMDYEQFCSDWATLGEIKKPVTKATG